MSVKKKLALSARVNDLWSTWGGATFTPITSDEAFAPRATSQHITDTIPSAPDGILKESLLIRQDKRVHQLRPDDKQRFPETNRKIWEISN